MARFFEFAANHWILVSLFFALLAALFFVEGRRAGRKISAQEAVQMINRGEAVLVDIRERKDFREGHIRDSLHIPLSSVKEKASELKKYDDKQIILVDKAGQHASHAGKLLKAEGIENVARLSGGIMDWRGANLPLVKK